MVQTVVALGGNLGQVAQTFKHAQTRITQHEQVLSVRAAGLYRSIAMGAEAGGEFFNSAWALETTLEPLPLLDLLQEVEDEFGRTRDVRWGPRTLDLDLIVYDQQTIECERLSIPHPHFWYRNFVLTPLESVLADFVHPVSGLTIRELTQRLSQRPFRLVWGGPIEFKPLLEQLVNEFSEVELRHVNLPDEVKLSQCSLAVWVGDHDEVELQPLWLKAWQTSLEQTMRDVLTAACTEVVAVRPARHLR